MVNQESRPDCDSAGEACFVQHYSMPGDYSR